MTKRYRNCTIITGTGNVIDSGWLQVENGTIADLGLMSEIKSNYSGEDIHLDGMTVMPGMIDCHLHLVMDGSPDPTVPLMGMDDSTATITMINNAWKTVNAGFTTIRDLGCLNHVGLKVRDAINNGLIAGPRILCAGQMICMTGGHGWQIGIEADGPDEVRKAVRKQLKAGVDVVKLMATGGICTKGVEPGQTQYSLEEMAAGVEEAHKAGVPAAAHAQGLDGVKIALHAGIDTIEHGMNLDDEAIRLMIENNVSLIPTLSAGAHIIRNGIKAGIPSYIVEKSIRHREDRIKSCINAFKAGVCVALGTDAGTPFNLHGNNAFELSELYSTGMTPHEIIISATAAAAKALKISHITGTLQIGRQSDLLILKKNPLMDIKVLGQRHNIADIHVAGKSIFTEHHFQTGQESNR